MNAAILAHQGGWDEALLVLVPIVFIFVVLWFAKRKAEQLDVDATSVPNEPSSTSGRGSGRSVES